MTPPAFGQVNFTLIDVSVFAYDPVAGTYGTGVALEYVNVMEAKPEADTDEIMTGGMAVESLAVVTKATGKMTFAAMNLSAYVPLFGITPASAGATNKSVKRKAGGRGNPYFGLIGRIYGLGTSMVHMGFCKVQMQSHPAVKIEQNKFVLPEVDILMMTADPSDRSYWKDDTRSVEVAMPSDFATWWAAN